MHHHHHPHVAHRPTHAIAPTSYRGGSWTGRVPSWSAVRPRTAGPARRSALPALFSPTPFLRQRRVPREGQATAIENSPCLRSRDEASANRSPYINESSSNLSREGALNNDVTRHSVTADQCTVSDTSVSNLGFDPTGTTE
jgi:hypothetical protein